MNFYTIRDLHAMSNNVWETLAVDGEVVITNEGKPTALMLNIAENNYEDVISAVRQLKAIIALNTMRTKAKNQGYMSDNEIEAEIEAYHREKNRT